MAGCRGCCWGASCRLLVVLLHFFAWTTGADVATNCTIEYTPRDDKYAEARAADLDQNATASDVTYERLVLDRVAIALTGIATPDFPSVAEYRNQYGIDVMDKILIDFNSSEVLQAHQRGDAQFLSCIEVAYSLQWLGILPNTTTVVYQSTSKVINWNIIIPPIAALPEVNGVEVSKGLGDGSYLVAARDDTFYHYFYREASGDCPSGCIDEKVTYFVSKESGMVARVGVDGSGPDSVYPDSCWWSTYQTLRLGSVATPTFDPDCLSASALALGIVTPTTEAVEATTKSGSKSGDLATAVAVPCVGLVLLLAFLVALLLVRNRRLRRRAEMAMSNQWGGDPPKGPSLSSRNSSVTEAREDAFPVPLPAQNGNGTTGKAPQSDMSEVPLF